MVILCNGCTVRGSALLPHCRAFKSFYHVIDVKVYFHCVIYMISFLLLFCAPCVLFWHFFPLVGLVEFMSLFRSELRGLPPADAPMFAHARVIYLRGFPYISPKGPDHLRRRIIIMSHKTERYRKCVIFEPLHTRVRQGWQTRIKMSSLLPPERNIK